jgi:hypothetical protein
VRVEGGAIVAIHDLADAGLPRRVDYFRTGGTRVVRVLQKLPEDGVVGAVAGENLVNQRPLVDRDLRRWGRGG